MSTITKDLGAVSAYAYAVEQGYTGTEAEFAELMASYATVAEQASQSAQTATEKAQQASASATSASQSADTTSASATSAQASAQTASTKAQEASQSASTASQKAQEASQSATDAESAKTASETAQASAESARDDAESARDEAQQYAESIDPQKLIGAYPVDTASGSIASFTDGADNIPMKSVKVRIEPVQDLRGQDAPYPAGGGVNLANKASVMPSGGVTATLAEDGTITLNGTATTVTYVLGAFDCNDATATYTWAVFNTMAYPEGVEFSVRNANRASAGGWDRINAVNKTFTFTPDPGSTPIQWQIQINAGTTLNQAQFRPMIVKGSTVPTAYAPYSNICPISGWTGANVSHSGADTSDATVYSITFPSEVGTVYGGTLDVVSGELVVDRANIASYNGETLPSTWISDRDAYAQGATPTTGAQVVYELATPITLTLSPTEIRSLLGTNNVFADTGDTTAEYRADTKLYIQKKISEAVNALS